jgi:succinate dehydrogenase flavin-adding protein (antitoxin of CptAB toxin-antitoxin module)
MRPAIRSNLISFKSAKWLGMRGLLEMDYALEQFENVQVKKVYALALSNVK